MSAGVYLALTVLTGVNPFNPFDNRGDPGGAILAQLRPVATAVPNGARIDYMYFIDSKQDSCDGDQRTVGWDPPTVQGEFTWKRGSVQTLYASFNHSMRRLAWKAIPNSSLARVLGSEVYRLDGLGASVPGSYSWQWAKTLASGRMAVTQLSFNGGRYGDRRWELFAEAPAALPPPGGC